MVVTAELFQKLQKQRSRIGDQSPRKVADVPWPVSKPGLATPSTRPRSDTIPLAGTTPRSWTRSTCTEHKSNPRAELMRKLSKARERVGDMSSPLKDFDLIFTPRTSGWDRSTCYSPKRLLNEQPPTLAEGEVSSITDIDSDAASIDLTDVADDLLFSDASTMASDEDEVGERSFCLHDGGDGRKESHMTRLLLWPQTQSTTNDAGNHVMLLGQQAERTETALRSKAEVGRLERQRVERERIAVEREVAKADDQVSELQAAVGQANTRCHHHDEARKAFTADVEKLRKEARAIRERASYAVTLARIGRAHRERLRKELQAATFELQAAGA